MQAIEQNTDASVCNALSVQNYVAQLNKHYNLSKQYNKSY